MRSGICPKCGSTGIRTAVSGLLTGGRQGEGGLTVSRKLLVSRGDTADYVCLGCGYVEQYLLPGKTLNWIAAHWTAVPVRTRTPERDHMAMRELPGVQDRIPEGHGIQDRVPERFEPHAPHEDA